MLSEDRVSFPVAESRAAGDHCRALRNALALRDLAAPVVSPVAFAAALLAPEVGVERAARLFIGIDVLIDALVTGGRLAASREGAVNLFWREVLAEQRGDLPPGVASDFSRILLGLAPRLG